MTSVLPLTRDRPLKRFPGPRGHVVMGSLGQAWEDPLALFTRSIREHGDLVRFRFVYLPYYLVNDALGAHHILVENAKGYHKSPNYSGLKFMLGQGLLTSEGETWRRQRKLAQPAFHRESLKGFADTMARTTADFIDRWKGSVARTGEEFDLHAETMRLTFRIVGKTLLSADLEADARDFGNALNVGITWANEYVDSLVRVPPWVPLPKNIEFKKAQRTIEGVVKRVVDERRASSDQKKDLLGMLMNVVDETTGQKMDDQQLMDELLTLVLAGHETTANALAFAFYLLSRHPEVAKRARAEARRVLGGRVPTLEDLPELAYTRAVIEETMRLYPPAWVVERISLEEDEVLGHHVPKDTIVAVSPYAMHRNPRYWDNPEGFDPERFLKPDPNLACQDEARNGPSAGARSGRGRSEATTEATHRPKLAYMPFGGGPRTCIGNAFAMMEMQIALSMLLDAFELNLVPGFRLDLDPSVTLRPLRGVWMQARRA